MDFDNNKWIRSNVGRQKDSEKVPADNVLSMFPDVKQRTKQRGKQRGSS